MHARCSGLLIGGLLAVELTDEQLGTKHVLLRTSVLEALPGDRSKIFEDLPVLGEDLIGLGRGKKIAVGALHRRNRIELSGRQFSQRYLDIVLGRFTAQPQRAEPRELLSEREVVGIVTHQGILRCNARDGKDHVRGNRVVERGHWWQPVLERLDVVEGGLNRSVFGQGTLDECFDRLRSGEIDSQRSSFRRNGRQLVRGRGNNWHVIDRQC